MNNDLEKYPSLAKPRLSHTVTQSILDAIKAGAYKRGDKLPSEEFLSQEYKVSRTVVRESIKQLEALGILQTITGSGSYVRSLEFYQLERLFSLFLVLAPDHTSVLELFDLRATVEIYAVQLLARRNEEISLRPLEFELKKMKKLIENGDSLKEKDANAYYDQVATHLEVFHKAVVDATGNKLFRAIVFAFIENWQTIYKFPERYPVEFPNNLVAQIEFVYQAIRQGDAGEAAKAMKLYMRDAREYVYTDNIIA